MRLFIAIELPGDVKKMLGSMRSDIPSAHWVPIEQLHLTLSFLGEVDCATLEQLTGGLAAIQTPKFDLHFSSTGCFPGHGRPRVIWVGLEPEPLLSNLATLVRKAVLSCGIPQEERPFSAHITLARLKFPASREVAAFLAQPQKQELPPVSVREFILFQSRLTPHGALHTPLRTFSLV
jgi:RNA 2',3'-cyclic 3'-phosphodiesterase